MADIFEVLRRAETGDYIKEDDYNMKLYKTNKKLVKKYGLKFDKENVIVSDDQMASNLFDAALELCEEMGMLCVDTSRVIRFTREELLQALEKAPKDMLLGEGKDARHLRARRLKDGYKMCVCGGCPGTPLPGGAVPPHHDVLRQGAAAGHHHPGQPRLHRGHGRQDRRAA